MPLTLFSPAFADGERIPEKYTRDGENMSPHRKSITRAIIPGR